MRRVFGRIAGLFSNRNFEGVDKAGNKYFTRKEQIDGSMKEKRWVIFKGEEDPTSIPVEWISWLNGQRKKAPTPEEMMELEARREQVRQNVALLKKEEEERKAKEGSTGKRVSTGKVSGPDLKSFVQQLRDPSEGVKVEESSGAMDGLRDSQDNAGEKEKVELESSEPTGSGPSFRPGTWQPPT
ncbi:uncharacterized protein LOC130725966 [Lotus japonicus]|uniref:NADH dehydrogenase [ubiquinone] 1 alpha subcomplex subunit 12 n=1 Tax=Lotus japonicus TaxID=34305 RepID=I3S7M7_LOTJA|nr:uncharacterized protein LOC130725966 [Lotus japonicus]AFK36269.1 unknown [Lotus japonicus]